MILERTRAAGQRAALALGVVKHAGGAGHGVRRVLHKLRVQPHVHEAVLLGSP